MFHRPLETLLRLNQRHKNDQSCDLWLYLVELHDPRQIVSLSTNGHVNSCPNVDHDLEDRRVSDA
jgi:hypothetical protein